jgi:hypothetical protein
VLRGAAARRGVEIDRDGLAEYDLHRVALHSANENRDSGSAAVLMVGIQNLLRDFPWLDENPPLVVA